MAIQKRELGQLTALTRLFVVRETTQEPAETRAATSSLGQPIRDNFSKGEARTWEDLPTAVWITLFADSHVIIWGVVSRSLNWAGSYWNAVMWLNW